MWSNEHRMVCELFKTEYIKKHIIQLLFFGWGITVIIIVNIIDVTPNTSLPGHASKRSTKKNCTRPKKKQNPNLSYIARNTGGATAQNTAIVIRRRVACSKTRHDLWTVSRILHSTALLSRTTLPFSETPGDFFLGSIFCLRVSVATETVHFRTIEK